MIQTLIHRWQEKAQIKAPVTRLCTLLGVSRAGVYAARERQRRPACVMHAAVRAAFDASGRIQATDLGGVSMCENQRRRSRR